MLLDHADRARFQRRAEEEGLSLSAWLREAGRQRLAAQESQRRWTEEDLSAFFAECDRREQGQGDEPDWAEHLAVIDASRASGRAGS